MPLPGSSSRCSSNQPSRLRASGSRSTPRRSDARASGPRMVMTRSASPRAALPAELFGDIRHHPAVRRRGGREHRDAGRKSADQLAKPAVVRPEIVPPVGDAVRLVDDEHPGPGDQVGQLLVPERRVVEPLRGDQQHVDLVVAQLREHVVPLVLVGRVDRDRPHTGARRRGDLVAHQREQRRDQDRRAGAAAAQAAGWRRSRPRTCPIRCAAPPGPGGADRRAPRSPRTARRGTARRRGRRGCAGCRWRPSGCRSGQEVVVRARV